MERKINNDNNEFVTFSDGKKYQAAFLNSLKMLLQRKVLKPSKA